nr:uncharacterized protein LOC126518968 isoform X2 [Dermacentor andersoni]
MSQFPETEASLHHKGDCGTMQPEQHDKASDLPALTRCGWACRKSVSTLLCCRSVLVLISTSELASQRPGATVLCFIDKVWLGLQKSCKQTAVLLISADLHVRVGATISRHHGAFTRFTVEMGYLFVLVSGCG